MSISLKQTDTRLILRHHDEAWTFATIVTFVVMLIALAQLTIRTLVQGGVVTLTCDRVEPTLVDCVRTQTMLMGLLRRPDQMINRVQSVQFMTFEEKSGDSTHHIYQTSLVSPTQTLLIARSRSFSDGHDGYAHSQQMRITAQIQNYLASTEPQLYLVHDTRDRAKLLLLITLGMISIGGLVLLIVISANQTTIFDKTVNQLVIERTCLFKSRQEYLLDSLIGIDIDIEEIKENDGDLVYKLVLRPGSGQAIPITSGYGTETKLQDAQVRIQQFLKS